MRKASPILNMKNCTTTHWLYRSKTVIACAVASLALRGVQLFAQTPDVVVQWNDASLQGVRDSRIGPPTVARALFTVHNCIYDAWAAYDRTAVGTVFGRYAFRSAELTLRLLIAVRLNRSRFYPNHSVHRDLTHGSGTSLFGEVI